MLSTRQLLSTLPCYPRFPALGRVMQACRHIAGAATSQSLSLVYDAPGEPADVLRLAESGPLADPGHGEMAVQFLLAPINPSDINTVQGKYPLQPTLPGTPGHEGVARVLAAGPGVEHCREGDLVVPLEPAQGTWRQRALVRASAFHALHPDTPLEAAATLCINPPTALAMLETFVELKEGDVIVQNGGTSAVGQLVTQLARARGVKTVSVIRPRPDWEAIVQRLKGLGADLVTTDSALKEDLKAAKLGPTPLLGLNCVGGTSALALCKVLGEGGTLVTYGGMSMQPVTIPTSLLIFKDLQFKGFWLSGRFAREQGAVKRAASLDYLAKLAAQGQLHTRTVRFPLAQWREALAAPSTGAKVLLDMESS